MKRRDWEFEIRIAKAVALGLAILAGAVALCYWAVQ